MDISLTLSLLSLLAGGAISLFIAKHFTLKSGIKVQISSISIFDNNEVFNNKIDVTVNDRKVNKLVKSSIKIWNSGFQTIYGTDIVFSTPFGLVFPLETNILNVSIEKTTDEDMQFTCVVEGSVVEINFNYCQPNNGVRIEILHDANGVVFNGKLKSINSKNIKVNSSRKVWYKRNYSRYYNKVYRIIFPLVSMLLFYLISIVGVMFLFTTPLIQSVIGMFVPIILLIISGMVGPYIFKFLRLLLSQDDGPSELD